MNSNKDNICGLRIKALRKKNKLTQNQLARLLHMSRSTVLKYETVRITSYLWAPYCEGRWNSHRNRCRS